MASRSVQFGRFDFSPESGELRRGGVPVRLQRQPAKVLAVLVARAGAVVTRDELQREVWDSDTHVDFERGLNFCIAQIRTALGDAAESPRYLETLPKKGYRFIAPVRDPAEPAASPAPAASRPSTSRPLRYVAAAMLVAAAGFALSRAFSGPPTVVVIPFYNETGRKDLDAVASGLADGLVARLAADGRPRHVAVIGNAPVLRNPFARKDVQEIGRKLDAEYLVIGQLKTDGERLRLIAHFIRVSDMKHIWAHTYDDDRFTLEAQTRTSEAVAAAVAGTVQPQNGA